MKSRGFVLIMVAMAFAFAPGEVERVKAITLSG